MGHKMKNINKIINSTAVAIIAAIGFVACFISFIIGIMNQKYIVAVLFLFASLYCLNHTLLYIKYNKR